MQPQFALSPSRMSDQQLEAELARRHVQVSNQLSGPMSGYQSGSAADLDPSTVGLSLPRSDPDLRPHLAGHDRDVLRSADFPEGEPLWYRSQKSRHHALDQSPSASHGHASQHRQPRRAGQDVVDVGHDRGKLHGVLGKLVGRSQNRQSEGQEPDRNPPSGRRSGNTLPDEEGEHHSIPPALVAALKHELSKSHGHGGNDEESSQSRITKELLDAVLPAGGQRDRSPRGDPDHHSSQIEALGAALAAILGSHDAAGDPEEDCDTKPERALHAASQLHSSSGHGHENQSLLESILIPAVVAALKHEPAKAHRNDRGDEDHHSTSDNLLRDILSAAFGHDNPSEEHSGSGSPGNDLTKRSSTPKQIHTSMPRELAGEALSAVTGHDRPDGQGRDHVSIPREVLETLLHQHSDKGSSQIAQEAMGAGLSALHPDSGQHGSELANASRNSPGARDYRHDAETQKQPGGQEHRQSDDGDSQDRAWEDLESRRKALEKVASKLAEKR